MRTLTCTQITWDHTQAHAHVRGLPIVTYCLLPLSQVPQFHTETDTHSRWNTSKRWQIPLGRKYSTQNMFEKMLWVHEEQLRSFPEAVIKAEQNKLGGYPGCAHTNTLAYFWPSRDSRAQDENRSKYLGVRAETEKSLWTLKRKMPSICREVCLHRANLSCQLRGDSCYYLREM